MFIGKELDMGHLSYVLGRVLFKFPHLFGERQICKNGNFNGGLALGLNESLRIKSTKNITKYIRKYHINTYDITRCIFRI
jgi:hypothetical protein